MTELVVFHGTAEEASRMAVAITHNCVCEYSPADGHRVTTCGPHKMLTEDQRALNGLVYARRMAERLTTKEWTR